MRTVISILSIAITTIFLSLAAAAEQRAAESAPHPIAKGPIEAIDAARQQLTIRTKQGTRTFGLTDRTYIFRGKEKITADQLKVGEIIALRYYTDQQGRLLLHRIKAQAAEATPTSQ